MFQFEYGGVIKFINGKLERDGNIFKNIVFMIKLNGVIQIWKLQRIEVYISLVYCIIVKYNSCNLLE